MYNGYEFYMAGMKLPIAPPSLEITVGSKNEVVDLINEGEINILKSPSLTEVSFEARFPMRPYPYAPTVQTFDAYYNQIKSLKENKTPFSFIVARATPDYMSTWDTNITVALEEFTMSEDWEEGDDVLISFTLRQWKAYGTKTVKVSANNTVKNSGRSAASNITRPEKSVTQKTYKVKTGDTLWGIAEQHFGDGTRWTEIYDANQATIENAAKNRGLASSESGHWIWQGTELVLPEGGSSTTVTSAATQTAIDNSQAAHVASENTVINNSSLGGDHGGYAGISQRETPDWASGFRGSGVGGGGSATLGSGGGRNNINGTGGGRR